MSTNENEESSGSELANEIFSFKELITVIVDYYCFKNNITEDEERDGEDWKLGTKYDDSMEEIIPEEMNTLIETAFKSQIKRFIKE